MSVETLQNAHHTRRQVAHDTMRKSNRPPTEIPVIIVGDPLDIRPSSLLNNVQDDGSSRLPNTADGRTVYFRPSQHTFNTEPLDIYKDTP